MPKSFTDASDYSEVGIHLILLGMLSLLTEHMQ